MAGADSDGSEGEPLAHVVVAGATRELRRVRRADGTTAIVKVVHAGGEGGVGNPRWRPTNDERDAYYWKREPLAYSSGLLAREFDSAFRAPALIEARELDDAMAIEIEDVDGLYAPEWPLEQYGVAARHLGAAQGRYLTGERPLPTEPWLSRDFIRAYNQRHGVEGNEFLAVLDALPRAFVHHDLHPGNLFAASDGTTVAIDWAFCGISAFTDDAANLVLDTMLDVVIDARHHAHELYEIVVDGFSRGLADAGWTGSTNDVRLAIDAGMVGKFLWFDAHHRTIVDVAEARAAVERKYRQPYDEVHAQRTAAMVFMHERAEAVRRYRRSAG